MIEIGNIIDYFGSSDISLGLVKKADANRATVEGITGNISHVTPRQVIASYSVNGGGLKVFSELQNSIAAAESEIDLELLWGEINGNSEKYGVAALSQLYFGDDASLHLSAMARKLCEDSLHFQRQGQEFMVRTPEMVEEQRQLLAARAEKAALKARRATWLAQVIGYPADASTPMPVPPEMEEFVGLCRDYLMLGFNSDAVNLMAALKSKSTIREIALSVLKKTNRLPADADEFLLVNGIHAGFVSAVNEYAEQLASNFKNAQLDSGRRRDLTHLRIFSIDDEWTKEIDDALSIESDGNGGWNVGIHLANPSEFVKKDDVLDEVAVERPLSLYLPTTTVTMFPAALSCNLASLSMSELRPAFSVLVHFDENFEFDDENWEICSSKVIVSHRLTYTGVDEVLSGKPFNGDARVADDLRILSKISSKLALRRAENGAVNLNRPEVKLIVKDGEIFAYREDQETPSYHLVREFMVLCNHLAAKFALRNDIPVIYRCQEESDESVHSVEHYNPVDFDIQVRKMRRTRLSTYPMMHFGLGLDVYTQISSPLRRYADLVIQRQIFAFLHKEPIPYTQEELFGVLDNAERTAMANRSLEREAHKYWLLEYLRRNFLGKTMFATIVRLDGNLVLAELDEYFERGAVITRERFRVGQRIQVVIDDIRPKLGKMALRPAGH